MEKDIIAILSEKNALFSKRQRAVADYICEHPDSAAFMTAEMLAHASGVSESTVVRFALELGFEGYPDMRKSVQELLRRRLTPAGTHGGEEAAVNHGELFEKTVGEYSQKISALSEGSNPENFDRAMKLLLKAERVFVFGAGEGRAAAHALWRGLNLMRDGAVLLQGDAYEQLAYIGAGDALVCIGLGSVTEHRGAARYAHESGAAVILIAPEETQPYPVYADSQISLGKREETQIDPLFAAVGIVGALLRAFSASHVPAYKEARKKIENIRQEYETNEHR